MYDVPSLTKITKFLMLLDRTAIYEDAAQIDHRCTCTCAAISKAKKKKKENKIIFRDKLWMQTKVSGAINQTNQRLTHCRLIATPLVAATPLARR